MASGCLQLASATLVPRTRTPTGTDRAQPGRGGLLMRRDIAIAAVTAAVLIGGGSYTAYALGGDGGRSSADTARTSATHDAGDDHGGDRGTVRGDDGNARHPRGPSAATAVTASGAAAAALKEYPGAVASVEREEGNRWEVDCSARTAPGTAEGRRGHRRGPAPTTRDHGDGDDGRRFEGAGERGAGRVGGPRIRAGIRDRDRPGRRPHDVLGGARTGQGRRPARTARGHRDGQGHGRPRRSAAAAAPSRGPRPTVTIAATTTAPDTTRTTTAAVDGHHGDDR